MDKEELLKASRNLYRLTLLFPKKEPLRYKLRGLADEILANAVFISTGTFHQSKNLIFETEKQLEVLDSYLELAKSQNWVSPTDILEMQEEYATIKKELTRAATLNTLEKREELEILEDGVEEEKEAEVFTALRTAGAFDSRQKERAEREEAILAILKERGKVQVGDLKEAFPQISKRTLRRDVKFLVKEGIVERVGERNDTFYQLKS